MTVASTTTSNAALIIAIIAAAISLLAAGWNALSFYLQGSRVRVEMKIGQVDSAGTFYQEPIREPGRTPASWRGSTRSDPFRADVTILTVRNRGRIPITISGVQLDFAHGPTERGRRAFTGIFLVPGELKLPRRLEAGDACMFIQAWRPMIGHLRNDVKVLRMRGQAMLGSGKIVWSRRPLIRRRWWLLPERWRVPTDPPDVRERIFTEFLVHTDQSGESPLREAGSIATMAYFTLKRGHTRDELVERLDHPRGSLVFTLYEIDRLFHEAEDHPVQ